MGFDPKNYPKDWKKIVARVKKRAGGRCECKSECGLHTTTGRCIERDGEPAQYARGRIVLTTAHLCHETMCKRMAHLRSMCQRCHLRYDRDHHQKNARETRRRKKAIGELFA